MSDTRSVNATRPTYRRPYPFENNVSAAKKLKNDEEEKARFAYNAQMKSRFVKGPFIMLNQIDMINKSVSIVKKANKMWLYYLTKSREFKILDVGGMNIINFSGIPVATDGFYCSRDGDWIAIVHDNKNKVSIINIELVGKSVGSTANVMISSNACSRKKVDVAPVELRFTHNVNKVFFSENSTIMFVLTSIVHAFSVHDGTVKRYIPMNKQLAALEKKTSVLNDGVYDRDHGHVLTIGANDFIKIWDIHSSCDIKEKGTGDSKRQPHLSPFQSKSICVVGPNRVAAATTSEMVIYTYPMMQKERSIPLENVHELVSMRDDDHIQIIFMHHGNAFVEMYSCNRNQFVHLPIEGLDMYSHMADLHVLTPLSCIYDMTHNVKRLQTYIPTPAFNDAFVLNRFDIFQSLMVSGRLNKNHRFPRHLMVILVKYVFFNK